MNVLRDRIARRAAALLEAGHARTVEEAIPMAAHTLGFPKLRDLPHASEVRRHLQGMAQEALGHEGYAAMVRGHFALAAAAMGLLERAFAARTLLAGRGARGQFDGGAQLHIRVYARTPVHAIAQALVDAGFEEPRIETIETTHGRANRLRFAHEGVELLVTRCLPEWWDERAQDLVTGKRTDTKTLEEVESAAQDPAPERENP